MVLAFGSACSISVPRSEAACVDCLSLPGAKRRWGTAGAEGSDEGLSRTASLLARNLAAPLASPVCPPRDRAERGSVGGTAPTRGQGEGGSERSELLD